MEYLTKKWFSYFVSWKYNCCWSVCNNFLQGRKLHFIAPIGALLCRTFRFWFILPISLVVWYLKTFLFRNIRKIWIFNPIIKWNLTFFLAFSLSLSLVLTHTHTHTLSMSHSLTHWQGFYSLMFIDSYIGRKCVSAKSKTSVVNEPKSTFVTVSFLK